MYLLYRTFICCGAGGVDWKMSILYSTVLYSIVLYLVWTGRCLYCTVLHCVAGGVDWKSLVEKRDAYVERLNGIYAREDLATKAVIIHLPHQYLQSVNQ